MSKATLNQAAKILSIFEDTPSEQIQAILASGFLVDLRDGNIAKLNRDEFRKLVDLVEPALPIFPTVYIQLTDTKAPKPPYDGWGLAKDVVNPIGTLELKLVEFLEENDMVGEQLPDLAEVHEAVVLDRARRIGPILGERHARALLSRQDRIPKVWQEFYLIFPGTVWSYPMGLMHAREFVGFNCNGGTWKEKFHGFGCLWPRNARIVSARVVSNK